MVIRQLRPRSGVRSRSLGPIRIKGRVELCEVFRIEWQTEMLSEFLALPADLDQMNMKSESVFSGIELGWLNVSHAFNLTDLPLIGAPFTDSSAPTVSFRLVDGQVVLG